MEEFEKYIHTVKEFADHVLRYGKDQYGESSTPLFVDGLNVTTYEPVKWLSEGMEWILSTLIKKIIRFIRS